MRISSQPVAPAVPTNAMTKGEVVALQAAAQHVRRAVERAGGDDAAPTDAATLMVRSQVDPMKADEIASVQQALGFASA